MCNRPSKSSTWRSVSFEPSMRVEEPTLSMVATSRSEVSFSGERLRIMRHCPLNSSSSAMSRRISGVMLKTGGNMVVLADCLADYSRLWLIRQTLIWMQAALHLAIGGSRRGCLGSCGRCRCPSGQALHSSVHAKTELLPSSPRCSPAAPLLKRHPGMCSPLVRSLMAPRTTPRSSSVCSMKRARQAVGW